jgi:hypothetical protein
MTSVRERLDSILEAQPRGGPEGCHIDAPSPAYICCGFWLADDDLDEIRPHLRRDEGYPDVGEVGRYRSVPVFRAIDRPADLSPRGQFTGVWFDYVPCLVVN